MPKKMNEWRVKLYQLEATGVWIDRGTGFVSCYQIPTEKDSRIHHAYLIVIKEEDQSMLLKSPILYEDAYERQGESIIMWRDRCHATHHDVDYALSFQETGGCLAIWESILDIQALSCNILKSTDHEQHNTQYCLSPDQSQESISLFLGLPTISPDHLDDIKFKLSSTNPSQKDIIISLVLDQDGEFIRNLLALSQESELSGALDNCSRIAEIIKGIVFLNNSSIIEFLLEDHIYPFVAAAMEFDPSLRSRPSYREVVAKSPNGPQCVLGLNFGKPHVQPLVQKLYRVKLLKDLMIRPLLDDTGAAAMNNLLTSLQTSICNEIFSDGNYLKKLLQEINSCSTLESNEKLCLLNLSRGTTESTIVDFSRSQSESSDYKEEIQETKEYLDEGDRIPTEGGATSETVPSSRPLTPTEDEKYLKLKRIHDCLGLLRELFFMSKQNLPMEQRGDLYSRSIQPMRPLFFTSLRNILTLRSVTISSKLFHIPHNERKFSILVNPQYQQMISTMRIMASEIISTCTFVCPHLLRFSILEGSVPRSPLTSPSNTSSNTEFSSYHTHSNESHDDSYLTYPHYSNLEHQSQSILFVIIERILCDDEVAVVEHLGDTLKVLLDPERIEKSEKEKFLSHFYDYYMSWMLLPFTLVDYEPDQSLNILRTLSSDENSLLSSTSTITAAVSSTTISSSPSTTSSSCVSFKLQSSSAIYASRRFLCEILSLCIFHHTYRIKSYITRSNLLFKCLRLLTCKSRYYHIYAIKLMRNIITLKDDHYNRYIIKHNLLKPIFELFSTLYHKDNIITSTIIDLIEFIRIERIQILIFYIVEKLQSYYQICLSTNGTEFSVSSRSTSPNMAHEQLNRNESYQNYYTELFEKLELTYYQLKEFEIEKERIERGGSAHEGIHPTNRSKRGPPGRSINELDSEDTYFDYEDEEEDEVNNSHKRVTKEENDYGPQPLSASPESPSSPSRKGGYFQGLKSSLNPSVHEGNLSFNGSSSSHAPVSSLSLIHDLYDDFEDHNDSEVVHEGNGGNDGNRDENDLSSFVHQSSEDNISHLPPLKSKFSSDDDDDEAYSQVFIRATHHSNKSPTAVMQKSGIPPNGGGGGANANGGISFTISNKKQRLL